MKRITVYDIKNRAVEFLEDMPTPSRVIYGTPVYDLKIQIECTIYLLEVYHKQIISTMVSLDHLHGIKAMIQFPEQEGAKWGMWVI